MLQQQAVAVAVRLEAELVEEHVARHRKRLAKGERSVRRAAGVVERHPADGERTPVEQDRVGGDQPTSSAAVAVTSLKVEPVG